MNNNGAYQEFIRRCQRYVEDLNEYEQAGYKYNLSPETGDIYQHSGRGYITRVASVDEGPCYWVELGLPHDHLTINFLAGLQQAGLRFEFQVDADHAAVSNYPFKDSRYD